MVFNEGQFMGDGWVNQENMEEFDKREELVSYRSVFNNNILF